MGKRTRSVVSGISSQGDIENDDNYVDDMDDDDDRDRKEKEWIDPEDITRAAIRERYERQKNAERNLIKVVKGYRHLPTMRMTMGQRRFLFFWHLAVILASLGMIGMGAFLTYWFDNHVAESVHASPALKAYSRWVKLKLQPKLSSFYGTIVEEYGSALIVLGLTSLFVTVFYISFLGHRFQFTWPILVIINVIALIFELSNILVRLAPVAQLASSQQTFLTEKIKKYQINSDDEFSRTYDFLSIWGHCCGITSVYDFQNTHYEHEEIVNGEKVTYSYQGPPVCCKEEKFKKGVDAVRTCAKDLDATWETGCFNVFFDLFASFKVVYVFAIGFLLMDLIIHISIYRDMVARLEPELGIDYLNKLEKMRREEWNTDKYSRSLSISSED